MTRESEATSASTLYMKPAEVAAELRMSRTAVYPLLESHGGPIEVVMVGTGRGALRVKRDSFDAYCRRIEAEAEARFRHTA